MLPVYLNTVEWGQSLHGAASIFTIHNLAYQGQRPFDGDDSSLSRWFPELDVDRSIVVDEKCRAAVLEPELVDQRGDVDSVVDDEVDFLETLVKRLQKRNIDTVGVTSGEEALAALKKRRFDVIILDIKMPGGG